MPRQVAFQAPVEIFIQKNMHSGKRQCVDLGLFQQGNDLFALDAGKAVDEIFDGIARLQMVEQAFHRHACALEDGLSAKNFRVLHDDLAHGTNLVDKEAVGEPNPRHFLLKPGL